MEPKLIIPNRYKDSILLNDVTDTRKVLAVDESDGVDFIGIIVYDNKRSGCFIQWSSGIKSIKFKTLEDLINNDTSIKFYYL
jgi:hypothetical protein